MEKITLLTFFELLISKIRACFLSKNTISSLSFYMPNSDFAKRYSHSGVAKLWYGGLSSPFRNKAAFLSICSLFFSLQIFGQVANVNPPTGGFAIDGGLRANTPTSPSPFAADQGDWYPGIVAGSGGSVFDNTGAVIAPATTQTSGHVFLEEPYGPDDDIFTNGSKFNDYVSALRWFENSAPDKNDIDNALYHVSRDTGNNQWIFISGDRLSTSGTSYIDFELLQGTIVQNTNGTFSGTPLAGKSSGGGRTENDIIISMEYTNGGSKPFVYIYQWKQSGNTWSYQLVTLAQLGANAFAETNRGGVESDVPYSPFGTDTYKQYAFVEAAVNVTYLINETLGGASCSGLNIKTLWVKTKASASSTAALKDFITPISVDFRFGTTEITPIAAKCADDNTAYPLSATPSGGTFSGPGVSGTGPYYFTPSAAGGAGTKTINYSSADGSCTGSIEIVVNANPTVTVNSPTRCTSDSAATITATPSPAGSYNYAWTVPAGATAPGNVASFASSVAGTYSVIITNPTTTCTGSGSGTLTVNTNPTVTVNSPTKCASDSPVTITATPSPAGSYNYVWTVPAGATAPGNVASFASSVAGTYSVIITNPTTTCTGSGSGVLTVNANPSPPSVTYNAPACDATTFSITVTGVINGATYTVKDRNGNDVPGLSPSSPHTAANTNNITFSNFPAGSGYQVSVSVGVCGSGTSSCGEPDSADKMAPEKKVMDTETSKVGFDAYPVPFKNILNIKYNFDYVSDVRIDVFNSQGVLVLSKNDTNSYLNKEVALDLKTNTGQGQVYIVKLTTDRGSSVKKIISSR